MFFSSPFQNWLTHDIFSVAFQLNVGCFKHQSTWSWTCVCCWYFSCIINGTYCLLNGLYNSICHLYGCLHDGLCHDMLIFHFCIPYAFSLSPACWECKVCLYKTFLCFSHHVMLFTVKEDNTPGCSYLCNLLWHVYNNLFYYNISFCMSQGTFGCIHIIHNGMIPNGYSIWFTYFTYSSLYLLFQNILKSYLGAIFNLLSMKV